MKRVFPVAAALSVAFLSLSGSNQGRAQTLENPAWFGPESRLLVKERQEGSEALKEAEGHYLKAQEHERNKQFQLAEAEYVAANLCTGTAPHIPSRLADYRLEVFGRSAIPQTPLATDWTYGWIGLTLICEKLSGSFRRFEETSGNDRGKDALLLIQRHIRTMQDIILQEKVLVGPEGYVMIGFKFVEFWAKGLLGGGIATREGQWRILNPEEVPPFEEWQVEERGPFQGLLFKLSEKESFIPGISLLADRLGGAFQKTEWNELIGGNVWEYCLIDQSFADLQSDAFMDFEGGNIMEKLGQRQKAVELYGRSANKLSGFLEPLLKLKELGFLKGMESALADELGKQTNAVEAVRSALFRIGTNLDDPVLLVRRDAALYHSYFVRNLLLGRIFASGPPSMGASHRLLGRWFTDVWVSGMKGFGVRLPKTSWDVEELSSKDWEEGTFIKEGFWHGCSRDKAGNILVPGIKTIKK